MEFKASTSIAHQSAQRSRIPVSCRSAMGVLMALAFVSGCVNPMFTRLPSFYASNPQVESYEFQRQDPFPDPDIAPDGGSRPPDFQRPRTESRKAAEQRLFQGMRQLPQTFPRGTPLSGQRHPASVL